MQSLSEVKINLKENIWECFEQISTVSVNSMYISEFYLKSYLKYNITFSEVENNIK